MTVPAVLAATALLLYLLGQSFNIMTLGGMAAAVGLIIDDAIVMSSTSCAACIAASGARRLPSARVLDAADEFMRAAGRLVARDDRHPFPAGLPDRRDRRILRGAVAHDGGEPVISFLVAWLVIRSLAAQFLSATSVESTSPHRHAHRSPRSMPR